MSTLLPLQSNYGRLFQAIAPFQKLTESGTAMTVFGLFFGTKLGESFFNLRKIKEGVVSEPVGAARRIEDDSFGSAAKSGQRLSITGGGQQADESRGAPVWWNLAQFAQQTCVVGLVVGILVREMRLVCGIARGVHAGRAVQRVHFQS